MNIAIVAGQSRPLSDAPMHSAIPPGLFARLGAAARYAVNGTAPESWFGPQKPLEPQAPSEVSSRVFGVSVTVHSTRRLLEKLVIESVVVIGE